MRSKLFVLFIFFIVCFVIPSTAYAYLDPGTGNALIYVVLSLAGAVLFFIKGVYYKLSGKPKDSSNESDWDSIVIFSEGKAYWHVFKPVAEKLMEKKQPFSYYTMDIEDPCLCIDSPYMENRYIGDGDMAYYKISNLSANLLLSTTPNIGTKGYPISHSDKIKKIVFISHAFDDLSFFHRYSLDFYDSVLLVGRIEALSIRALEKLRKLPAKELIPAGLPYLDELLKRVKPSCKKEFRDESDVTVLLAPSWGKKGFLNYYKTDFIELLADRRFNLIIRPHPQSLKVEKKLMQRIKQKLEGKKNIVWDFDSDNSKSLQTADILISDVSAIRYDFALVHQKPFITLPIPIPRETLEEYEIIDMEIPWCEEAFREIGYGYVVKDEELTQIDTIIMKILREKDNEAIAAFRDRNLYNLCNSASVIADYLIDSNRTLMKIRKENNRA